MADDYEAFLRGEQAPSQGPVSVPAGSGVDEYDSFLKGQPSAPAAPERSFTLEAEQAAGQPQEDQSYDYFLKTGKEQPGYFSTLGSLAYGGVKRNLEQFRAMGPSLRAIGSELQGDQAGAIEQANKAQQILKQAGDSEWSLQKIKDAETFSYWLAEKLGEQGITALATIGTGGVAGIGVNAVGKTLLQKGLLTEAGARALTLAGVGIPTYALSTAMETAGTSQEQFEVSKGTTTRPELSLGAGATKGLLELWTPLSIGRALVTPGLQLGKTTLGAFAKVAAREGATETAQEAIDITARKYHDPSYSYFKDGPTIMPSGWAEGAWRLAEAGAAGAAVGAVYGGPFIKAERAQETRREMGDEAPGSRRTVPAEAGLPQEIRLLNDMDQKMLDAWRAFKIHMRSERRLSNTTNLGVVFEGFKEFISNPVKNNPYELLKFHVDDAKQFYALIKRAEDNEQARKELKRIDGSAPDANLPQESRGKLELFPGQNRMPENQADSRGVAVREALYANDPTQPKSSAERLAELDAGVRENEAQARRKNFKAIDGGVGPITALRSLVMAPKVGDKLTQESRGKDPRDDALSLGPLLSTLQAEQTKEAFLNLLEANTPRYIEVSQKTNTARVWTDTELELEHAANVPQSYKMQLLKVNQGTLQPAAITALVSDLAPPNSDRIWFLPGTKPEERQRLLDEYTKLYPHIAQAQQLSLRNAQAHNALREQFMPMYTQLLNGGMRFVPSRGAGFHYNGVLEGEPIELKDSQRSMKVALYDPMTNQITPFSEDERFFGDQLTARAIVVSVDFNKVPDDALIKHKDGSFQLKQPLDPHNLVPGISVRHMGNAMTMVEAQSGFQRIPKSMSEFGTRIEDPLFAKDIKRAVDKVLPAIDQILASVGIKGRIGVHISDAQEVLDIKSAVFIRTEEGVIFISPKLWRQMTVNVGSLEATILSALMHEVGHAITYRYFKTSPVEVQEKLFYAFNKAQLAMRMGRPDRIVSAGIEQASEEMQGRLRGYWMTFPEWYAEQFRRWALSDAQPVGWIEQNFKQGAEKLERYYQEYEKKFGVLAKKNLSEPDYYFSAFMDYLRGFSEDKNKFQQLLKQQTVHRVNRGLLDTPTKLQITKQVDMALRSLQGIVPPEVQLRLNESLDPKIVPGMDLPASEGANARWIPDVNLIEIAVGVLPAERLADASRQVLSHEVMHAYESLDIISQQEIGVLMRDIKGHEQELFSLQEQQALRRRVADYGAIHGWSAGQIQAKFEEMRDRELRAYYIQRFADSGFAYSEEGKGLLSWLVATFERIRNFLQGLGYQTKEDVVRAFFKGEMVARRELQAEESMSRYDPMLYMIDQRLQDNFDTAADQTWQIGDMKVYAVYEGADELAKQQARHAIYHWVNKDGLLTGIVELKNRMPKGFEIVWLNSDNFMLAPQMLQHAERDLGIKMKVAAELTPQGYKQSQVLTRLSGRKGVLDLYQKITLTGPRGTPTTLWISPLEAKRRVAQYELALTNQQLRDAFGINEAQAKASLLYYRRLVARIPESTWNDPRLEQMFNLPRNHGRDEVQGALIRDGQGTEESQLLESLGQGQAKADAWKEAHALSQKLSQAENAKASGLSFELSAPSTALTYEVRKLWERATGYGSSPAAERELINTAHEMDRIGKFSKYAWTLDQLAWANEKATNIGGLLDLVQHKEQMNQLQNAWVRRADETAKEWRKVTQQKRRDGITDTLFALSEMDYLSQAEKAAGAVRLPARWNDFLLKVPPAPGTELSNLFKKHGLDPRDYELVRRVNGDFAGFLTDVENVSLQVLQRKFGNSPQALQTATAALQKDMAEFRQKPYFPMMRFGEFTIAVRENGKVVWASAFATSRQRDAAVADVRRKFPVGDITIGRVPPSTAEFMSLPGPLLRLIKESLFDKAGKTQDQVALIDQQQAWIEEFELLHSPDKTFRKRWMPSNGVPGYSMDAFRAYSHYFQYGSRYLARLAYMDQLGGDISRLRASIGTVGNYAKRAEIVRYAEDWLKYILEPGRDSGKFRAFFSFFYLAFSPAAAFMNLTQNFTTTIPWLGANFGQGNAYSSVVSATSAYSAARGKTIGTPAFQKAREEMVRQGFIDVGQAPELAAFAEGYNLNRLMAQTKLQKTWSDLSYWGMAMFSATEHFNREFVMKTAWDLAIKHPNTKRLNELDVLYPIEIAELQTRTGLTHTEALAFMFAKEGIKRTQFVYDKTSDPRFMRGKAKDFLIFFKYTQSMLHAFGNNGATIHMLLVMALLYGLSGVPGSEDANELIKLIGRKLFGKDWDPLKSVRELVRYATKGTPFDATGPDLALHGISRYGFGLGLLPQGWGAPRFDASANGAMGRLVPGLAEFANGVATGRKWPDIFAESAQRASGAGYGTFFNILQFLMEQPSADSKKWEQLLQREMKALAKAYRYGPESLPPIPKAAFGLPVLGMTHAQGAETTRGGAKIVKFDARDPDDIATVLAQAAGFTPTKVSQTWELMRAAREDLAVYDMRRKALYVQFDRVLSEQPMSRPAFEDMLAAIRSYNEDVIKAGDPSMAIKAQQLQQSLKERQRARQMQEQTLATNKREMMVMDRLKDLYPGVTSQKVK